MSMAAAMANISTSGAKRTSACHVMGQVPFPFGHAAAVRGGGLAAHMLLSSEVQRPRTLVPTVPMTAIAVTMIRPAISAYSSTSPPLSSRSSLRTKAQALLIQNPLHVKRQPALRALPYMLLLSEFQRASTLVP